MHAAFCATLMGTSLGLLSALASETNLSAQEAAPVQLSVELVDVSRTGVALPESLRKGLILYYSFDRDEKEKVSDNSSEHNDGVVHGATWLPIPQVQEVPCA